MPDDVKNKEPIITPGVAGDPEEQKYMEEALKDDPEYQEALKEELKANPAPKDGEDDITTDDGNEEDSADKVDDETGEGKGDEEGKDSEFEDDIIPGLKGAKFDLLDEEMREIITKTRESMDGLSKKNTETEDRLKKLLEDPVIRHREEILSKGEAEKTYDLPKITDADFNELTILLDQDTPEGRTEIRKKIDDKIKSAIELGENNARITENAKFQRIKGLTEAGKRLIEISKLHEGLKIDITDPEKLMNTPMDKLGNIGKYLLKLYDMQQGTNGKAKTITSIYGYINSKTADALYADVALECGLPVVKNADDKIRKIVKESNQKVYDRFRKNKDKGSGGMPATKEVDEKKMKSGRYVDGIDIIKLADPNNSEYHDRLINKHYADMKMLDKIGRLRERGEKMLAEHPELSSSS